MFDQQLVRDLESLEPGIMLAGLVSQVDSGRVSSRERVALLRARQRLSSYYAALVYEGMASISAEMIEEIEDLDLAADAASTEVAAALRLTRRAADAEVGWAVDLYERLPRVAQLLSSGRIDVRRAKTIAAGVAHLDEETAREVVERVAAEASELTTGQLAARLRRMCVDADPADAESRYRDAVDDRRVVVGATPSGTAHLLGLGLSPERVMAVSDRIDRLARELKRKGEGRSMDQLRADVFLEILEGTATGAGGVIDLRVDLDTLAGLSESPGQLAGYGPVIADVARRVAKDRTAAEWRCTVIDHDGTVVWEGVTRRRPSTRLRRGIEGRYPTCVFPGCRMPARACDLDHRTPWARGGVTCECNLAPLCRYHHRIRHAADWTYIRLADGTHQWTSPVGAVYVTTGQSP